MKKILLTFCLAVIAFGSQSQVIVSGVSPASIAGPYEFGTQADGGWPSSTIDENWGLTLDFAIPGTFIQDTLMLAEDGTPGVNAQGIDSTHEACSPLINDLTGKIALLYRNTCDFATKAWNAQQAGAIAVIVINREPATNLIMTATAVGNGPNVTIPVCLISSNAGAALVAAMQNGPVVMFIGNKLGAFAKDGKLSKSTALISKRTGVLSQLSQSGSEFNFDLGARVYNDGSQDLVGMFLEATIDGPGGNVYSESINLPTVLSGDSIDIEPNQALNFPQFSLATYPEGLYTLTYSLGLTGADDFPSDNEIVAEFAVQDSMYALASLDLQNKPTQNAGIRPTTSVNSFSNCIVFDDPNGSRVGVEGLYFSAITDTSDLSGEEIGLYAYRWEDVFTDINDAALSFNTLNPVTFGYYYYPSDLQGEVLYGAFSEAIALEDDQRFLFCAQSVNPDIFLGFDTKLNYEWNLAYYAQPLGPVENDGNYFAAGFGMEQISTIGAKIINASEIGLDETGMIEGVAYPNPAKDLVNISIETQGTASLIITDIFGKVVMSESVSFADGNTEVNIAQLEAGMYIFNVTLENGLASQFNVVKK